MKKVLLTAAAVSVLATSSAYAMEDMFYVKANVGWSKLNKVSGLKSNNDVHFGVGAGYHVMDNARVDLTFDHFVNPTHKKSTVKAKGDINSLLLNGYFDVFNVDAIKVFVGAGVGLGQVKVKYTDSSDSDSGTGKQKYSFAFAGYVGTGYEFTKGVTGELTYSYRDMGKTKKFKSKNGSDMSALHYRGHHVTAGVRFDI
ncbi:MAG: outer membrane beta-barrel protein [Rickettsiaceae bacterium]|nr:outer membrane beta-barrel protein [Rickettsiaceae bacterium]